VNGLTLENAEVVANPEVLEEIRAKAAAAAQAG